MAKTAEEIASVIAPSVQNFMRTNRDEIIASGHFAPLEKLYVRAAYPHFVYMAPTIIKSAVQSVLDYLEKSGDLGKIAR